MRFFLIIMGVFMVANECQASCLSERIEQQGERFFIGLPLKTSNEECSQAMPEHKARFFRENILEQIPHKKSGEILAVYTDYEGDYTQPYTWILGCEVLNLEEIPIGLVGKRIPAATYAVFTTEGPFLQGLIHAWQTIWQSPLQRSYRTDFEVYPVDFDPEHRPQVKIYIGLLS